MSEPFEQALRKAMIFLGRVVEAVIGKAKEAKVQVGSRGGMQPIISVEGMLDTGRIKELIESSIQKMMEIQLPDLTGKVALEIGEGPASYGARLLARRADEAIAVEIGGASIGMQGDISRGYVLRGNISALPFGNAKFPYVIARLATPFQGDMSRAINEIGRILVPGGQGVLVDYHPFGLYGRRGTGRLRPAESGIHCFEDYYRHSKKTGLRVVDIREVFVDEGMRGLFHEEEIQAYRHLKGTPLIVFIFFYKPRRKG